MFLLEFETPGVDIFMGKPGSNRTPALRTESEEAVRPHKFTCRSALTTADAAARGPREPLPGHGHRHLPHLAEGLRLDGYATQPEDFSACYLNQEDPFE